jgi:hypothetical protein
MTKDGAMATSLTPEMTQDALARLRQANLAFAQAYPGEGGERQAVHTVYGGAHLFKADTVRRMGELALKGVAEYFPDARTFASVLGFEATLAERVYARVQEKLRREPIEDFRIDFEDGYGNRPDAEEDGHAIQAAEEVAKGLAQGTLPPFIGIRCKPFTEELRERSVRSIDHFVTTLAHASDRRLPTHFVVTLPKVVIPEQVAVLAELLAMLEAKTGLTGGSIKIEIMVETTQSIVDQHGQVALPRLVRAGRGRCVGAHFGTYDYTAGYSITAAYQSMVHPACDFAKHMMKVSLAGTGVALSDGATNVLPVPRHRGAALTPEQLADNRAVVQAASKLHYDQARHSLLNGFYQGWDLHPAQLPTRYAAVYSFFLEGLSAASVRLKNFIDKAAQATLVGDVFDDAATGQGLLNFFLRGMNCGALTIEEARATGLTVDELRTRSFAAILTGRRQ